MTYEGIPVMMNVWGNPPPNSILLSYILIETWNRLCRHLFHGVSQIGLIPSVVLRFKCVAFCTGGFRVYYSYC